MAPFKMNLHLRINFLFAKKLSTLVSKRKLGISMAQSKLVTSMDANYENFLR